MTRRWVTVVLAGAALAGCGARDQTVVGDEPITPAAIAVIIEEHADLGQPSGLSEWSVFVHEFGAPSPSASLAFDDVSLRVGVAPTSDSSWLCVDPAAFDGCVDASVGGHDVVIAWQELEPEEDPGIVFVIDRRDGEDVVVQVTGTDITTDPRELDLRVPLADLAALAADPRISLTTSRSVVDLGDGVEVEPAGSVVTDAPG